MRPLSFLFTNPISLLVIERAAILFNTEQSLPPAIKQVHLKSLMRNTMF